MPIYCTVYFSLPLSPLGLMCVTFNANLIDQLEGKELDDEDKEVLRLKVSVLTVIRENDVQEALNLEKTTLKEKGVFIPTLRMLPTKKGDARQEAADRSSQLEGPERMTSAKAANFVKSISYLETTGIAASASNMSIDSYLADQEREFGASVELSASSVESITNVPIPSIPDSSESPFEKLSSMFPEEAMQPDTFVSGKSDELVRFLLVFHILYQLYFTSSHVYPTLGHWWHGGIRYSH